MSDPGPVPASAKPSYPIESVDSALRLLQIVAQRDRIRVGEAADELGVARSTAHRLMQMLIYHGLVRQDPESKAYSAGPELVTLGLGIVGKLDVRSIALPHMEDLVAQFAETVHLFALRPGGAVQCLASIESPHALRVGDRTGAILPAHTSATGRALLSTMSLDEVKVLYPSRRLSKAQPRSVSNRAELLVRLESVRQLGYASQREESEPGISAVSAPIRTGERVASFALTIACPSARLTDDMIAPLGRGVSRAARQIALSLGA